MGDGSGNSGAVPWRAMGPRRVRTTECYSLLRAEDARAAMLLSATYAAHWGIGSRCRRRCHWMWARAMAVATSHRSDHV
jgi:hypothetical protein